MAKRCYFTCEQVAEALRKSGGVVSGAAKELKCSIRTVYCYIERCPEAKQVVDERKERLVDAAEGVIIKGLKEGDKTSAIFILKTLGKHRGYSQRVEMTGPDGGPVQVDITGIAREFERAVLDAEEDSGGETPTGG